jgi:hypothetical protein
MKQQRSTKREENQRVTTARQTLVAVLVVTFLAVGGAGAALAAPQAPQALSPQCERLANGISTLESTRNGLAAVVAQLQQQIASGQLRPLQLRIARALVGGLQRQLARVDAALSRLDARFDEFCSEDGSEEVPPPPPSEE